jgi:PAS domain S-box-containing protein
MQIPKLNCFSTTLRLLLLSVMLYLCSGQLTAQQFNFHYYSVDDGLPHSQVSAVFQDSSGYIWVGTEGGVSRFDGKTFDVFACGEKLPGHQVTAVSQIKEGVIVATNKCIAVFSGGRFKSYPFPEIVNFKRVNLFTKGADGELILCTDQGLWKFESGKYRFIKTATPLDQLSIRAAYLDSQNKLWIGSARNGLFCLEKRKADYTSLPFPDQGKLSSAQIRGISEIEKGLLWIATSDNGLFSYDGQSMNTVSFPPEMNTPHFTSLLCDKKGDVWLGTWGNGLIHYRNGIFRQLSKNNGLEDDVVLSVYSDAQGNIWLGTYQRGLVFFYGEMFVSYTVKDGLPDNNVRSLVMDINGNMWMATLGGVAMFDGSEIKSWTKKDGLSNNRIGAVTADRFGKVYAGTMNGEINIFDNNAKPPVIIKPQPDDNPGEILSLCCASDGALWIGSASKGLFRMKDGVIKYVNVGNQLLQNSVWSIYEDVQGTIWLGTNRGLYKLDKGDLVRPKATKKQLADYVEQPIYDIDGDNTFIYIATHRSGIWRYNFEKQKYQVLNKEEGLGSNFIYGIQYNPQINLMYVTTMLGLDRIVFRETDQLIQHFWQSDGIGTSNFTQGALATDSKGRLWLGSVDGVVIYSPSLSKEKNLTPRLEFKELQLSNQPVEDWSEYTSSGLMRDGLPDHPVFPYDVNNLTFVFTGIQFGAGININYEYQLAGLDTGWVKLTSGNSVSFQGLEPGDYVFKLNARNSNGFMSAERTFEFTIRKPFWNTSWFFITVILVLLGITYVLFSVYRNYRDEFVKDQNTLESHNLTSGRYILIAAGIIYPLALGMIEMFMTAIDMNMAVTIIHGLVMLILGALSYSNKLVKKQTIFISRVNIGLMMMHLLYLIYLNNLSVTTVLALVVAMSCIGLVYDSMRDLFILSILIVVVSIIIILVVPEEMHQYNRWMFLLAIIVTLIISFITILIRLNLFNRLIFADTIINNSRSIVLAIDKKANVVFASRSITSVLGYTSEEVLGDGWWQVRSENQEENAERKRLVLTDKDANETYVVPIRAKNGAVRWIQWQDTVMDENIKVGIGLDVTDRHQIEERYRDIVESATDIIYTANFGGFFTYTNDVAIKILGYPLEELLGRHFTEFIHPDWVKEVTTFYAKQFQRKLLSTNLEFPVITGDGGIVWLGQTVRIIFDDLEPGRIRGFQAIARDITEKKQYEEELEKLSLVASETINGVLICDPDSNIEWVNEGFTRITGYSLAEVRNQRAGDVLKGEKTNMATIYTAREKVRTGEGFEVELLVYNSDGNEIWISVSNTPIVDENGRLLKQIEIFTDISEKKRYELQLSRYSKNLELLNQTRQRLLDATSVDMIVTGVLPIYLDHIQDVSRVMLGLTDAYHDLIEVYSLTRANNNKPELSLLPQENFISLEQLQVSRYRLVTEMVDNGSLSVFDKQLFDAGIRSYLTTSLQSEGRTSGFITLCSDLPDGIDMKDIDLMDEVAEVMANAVQQIRYREIIQQKNNDISSSIAYARRIQNAILPPEEVLRKELGDMFVLYRPKDVLCGDYYWAETRDDYTFIAVADSTGHGVPGALLSLMGHNLLNQAIRERHLTRPAAILDFLNVSIQQTLNQYKQAGELYDGMDIALCVFEKKSRTVMFSGAINPLYIVRNGQLIQVKGNRFSIGSYFDFKLRPFDHQEIELLPGDMIYLFTDGYPDQFGGSFDRKLSYRHFRDYLISISHLPAIEQREKLSKNLTDWMGEGSQTDDICILGLRIS